MNDEVRSILDEHRANPDTTNVCFGVDVVHLTSPDGLTVIRSAYFPRAGAIAWRMLRRMVSVDTSDQTRDTTP